MTATQPMPGTIPAYEPKHRVTHVVPNCLCPHRPVSIYDHDTECPYLIDAQSRKIIGEGGRRD